NAYWTETFRLLEEKLQSHPDDESDALIKELRKLADGFDFRGHAASFFSLLQRIQEWELRENQQPRTSQALLEELARLKAQWEQLNRQVADANFSGTLRDSFHKFLEQAQKHLDEATAALSASNLSSAQTHLWLAQNLLSASPDGFPSILLEERDRLQAQARLLFAQMTDQGLNQKLSRPKQEVLLAEETITQSLSKQNTGQALGGLIELQQKTAILESSVQKDASQKTAAVLSLFSKLRSLLSKIIPAQISILQKQLSDHQKLQDKIPYAPPITLSRIEYLQKQADEIPLNETEERQNRMEEQSDDISLAEESETWIAPHLSRAQSIEAELSDAIQKITADATTLLAQAQTQNPSSPATLESQKALESENFIQSIAFSKTALASLPSSAPNLLANLPWAILPLVGIMILVGAWKLKKIQTAKKPRKQVRIPKNNPAKLPHN
ncbi:MAG: hypothetical protein HY917_03920, partial [Candidatus Diapherotrites archaeon]|nr:hypothetical protein [Candidatus Diapherotrites archaeon]